MFKLWKCDVGLVSPQSWIATPKPKCRKNQQQKQLQAKTANFCQIKILISRKSCINQYSLDIVCTKLYIVYAYKLQDTGYFD